MRKLSAEHQEILRSCRIGNPDGIAPDGGWQVVGYSLHWLVLYHRREGWKVSRWQKSAVRS